MHMTKYDRAYLVDIVAIVTSFVITRRERETHTTESKIVQIGKH